MRRLNDRQTELVLHSSYELRTNLNWYAAFWGNLMLADFQERLLAVIKGRCNK
jgi:hypothetical protein